jgi:hypothetical protein
MGWEDVRKYDGHIDTDHFEGILFVCNVLVHCVEVKNFMFVEERDV